MRRTDQVFTTDEKALMLDIILDQIEEATNINVKSLPVEFRKDSRSGYIGYGIEKVLVDNGFLEKGQRKAQRSFV